jgi:nitroreductase
MMSPATGSAPPSLHPLLAARRSSRAFDPQVEVTALELAALIEAARWAPSSRNTQPWRFVVGRREDDVYKRVLARLFPHNQRWAANAPLLLVGAHLTRSADGRELPHAAYDLGQAVAHLTVQAIALGLHVHQIAGFDADGVHSDLGLPDDVRVMVTVAVGRLTDPAGLPEDLRQREVAPRTRRPAATLLLP